MATFETRDGVRLAYTDRGEGRPVVFLASWSLAGHSWDYQTTSLLAEGFRCLTLDRRGHGLSEDPGRGYALDSLADDVGELLERRDVRNAVLVGFSMGCAEAVRTAGRCPRRVGGLVLIGTTTPFLSRREDNPTGIDPANFAAFQQTLLADYPNWIEENLEPFAPGASPGMKGWIRTLALEGSLAALLACNRTLTTADQREELRTLRVPTLLIHGNADATSPLDLTARATAALLPDAQLEVYEGAPHGLAYTHRERLNADLLAFLLSVRAGDADRPAQSFPLDAEAV